MNFKELNIGGKLILLASALALGSIFMTWIDIDGMVVSGIEQKAYLFLVFYIYPLYKLFRNQPIQAIGRTSSLLAIVFGATLLGSISQNDLGETINAGGGGLYLYMTASILLNIGTIKYKKIEKNKKSLK